jgi:hypothetical protein
MHQGLLVSSSIRACNQIQRPPPTLITRPRPGSGAGPDDLPPRWPGRAGRGPGQSRRRAAIRRRQSTHWRRPTHSAASRAADRISVRHASASLPDAPRRTGAPCTARGGAGPACSRCMHVPERSPAWAGCWLGAKFACAWSGRDDADMTSAGGSRWSSSWDPGLHAPCCGSRYASCCPGERITVAAVDAGKQAASKQLASLERDGNSPRGVDAQPLARRPGSPRDPGQAPLCVATEQTAAGPMTRSITSLTFLTRLVLYTTRLQPPLHPFL